MPKNIILFGVPRSGTTWISEVLTAHNKVKLIHEPDNEFNSFPGLIFKNGLSRFPYLDKKADNKDFYTLFDYALNKTIPSQAGLINKLLFKIYGLQRSKLKQELLKNGTAIKEKPLFSEKILNILTTKCEKRKLIKSVHALLTVPYLLNHFDFFPLIVTRNPLNVFSSYKKINMPDANRNLYKQTRLLNDYDINIEKGINDQNKDYEAGVQLAIFDLVLKQNIKKYPQIVHVHYEDILKDPYEAFKRLHKKLSLDYNEQTENFIKSRFKAGDGYATYRIPEKQLEAWKSRLNDTEIRDFTNGYQMATREKAFIFDE